METVVSRNYTTQQQHRSGQGQRRASILARMRTPTGYKFIGKWDRKTENLIHIQWFFQLPGKIYGRDGRVDLRSPLKLQPGCAINWNIYKASEKDTRKAARPCAQENWLKSWDADELQPYAGSTKAQATSSINLLYIFSCCFSCFPFVSVLFSSHVSRVPHSPIRREAAAVAAAITLQQRQCSHCRVRYVCAWQVS